MIENEQQLRALYGYPAGRTQLKQLSRLEKHSKNFIKHSPFVTVATVSQEFQLDNSPRGGKPGFVKVLDNYTLIIPDSKGNKRLDSIVNIIHTAKVGCLFFIPGMDETLRLNGQAKISTNAKYIALFKEDNNPPISVIKITVEEVFLHCAKALMRSQLWSEQVKLNRNNFPTMGQMINDQIGDSSEPEPHQVMLERYQKDL